VFYETRLWMPLIQGGLIEPHRTALWKYNEEAHFVSHVGTHPEGLYSCN